MNTPNRPPKEPKNQYPPLSSTSTPTSPSEMLTNHILIQTDAGRRFDSSIRYNRIIDHSSDYFYSSYPYSHHNYHNCGFRPRFILSLLVFGGVVLYLQNAGNAIDLWFKFSEGGKSLGKSVGKSVGKSLREGGGRNVSNVSNGTDVTGVGLDVGDVEDVGNVGNMGIGVVGEDGDSWNALSDVKMTDTDDDGLFSMDESDGADLLYDENPSEVAVTTVTNEEDLGHDLIDFPADDEHVSDVSDAGLKTNSMADNEGNLEDDSSDDDDVLSDDDETSYTEEDVDVDLNDSQSSGINDKNALMNAILNEQSEDEGTEADDQTVQVKSEILYPTESAENSPDSPDSPDTKVGEHLRVEHPEEREASDNVSEYRDVASLTLSYLNSTISPKAP